MKGDVSRIKISVITLHTSINYGAVLQTYATKTVLENLGCRVEFVSYYRKNNTEQAYVKRMLNKKPLRLLNRFTLGLSDKALSPMALRRVRKRNAPFYSFIKEHIPLTERDYYSYDELKNDPPEADIYCTGSDQVWNSVWNGGIELPYFLAYAPEGKKKISFAASIGRDAIDEDEKTQIAPLLRQYDAISMREQSGVELLSSMGIQSELVLDPTLLLRREDWLKIARPVSKGSKGILLLYILNWNDQIGSYAKKLAERNGWNIIRICKSHSPMEDKQIQSVVVDHVEQLISWFDSASFILSDSFHATAFALNFHKQFASVLPPRFSTRIQCIMELTHTTQCLAAGYDREAAEASIDWAYVDEVLDREREKTRQFLEKAINGEG